MRVISGKYRGKKLVSPLDDSVRPTTDRIKETVFNILQWEVDGARVLDLFAGSGALRGQRRARHRVPFPRRGRGGFRR